MKGLFLFSVSASVALCAMLSGCDREPRLCDYYGFFVVENETDREITVTRPASFYDYYEYFTSGYNGYGGEQEGVTITIAPGESEQVLGLWESAGCNNPELLLSDDHEDDWIMPFGRDEATFTMMVDGEEIPEEIFVRKNWSYSTEGNQYTYTLRVTDTMLEILTAE